MSINPNFVIPNNKDAEIIKMIDYDSQSRARVYFLRLITANADGTSTISDVALDGQTPYTPTGVVYSYHQRFLASGGESIAFTDGATVSLTPPAGADVAEIHVWDANIVWDKRPAAPAVTNDGTVGYGRHADGAYFELEGAEEIANFQAIGFAGQAGRLEVNYVEGLHVND